MLFCLKNNSKYKSFIFSLFGGNYNPNEDFQSQLVKLMIRVSDLHDGSVQEKHITGVWLKCKNDASLNNFIQIGGDTDPFSPQPVWTSAGKSGVDWMLLMAYRRDRGFSGGQNWVESWPWICLWHVRQTIHSPSPAVLMETFPSVVSRKLRGQTQDLKTPGGAVVPSGFRDSPQIWASQVVLVVKNSPVNAGDIRDAGLILGWEVPMEKEMAPTPVFLPGESHG